MVLWGLGNTDPVLLRLILVVLILVLGFSLSRIFSKLVFRIKTKGIKSVNNGVVAMDQFMSVRVIRFLTIFSTVTIALLLLQVNLFDDFFVDFYVWLPKLISLALLVLLSFLIVNFIEKVLLFFSENTGLTEYLVETDKTGILEFIIFIIKFLLYIISLVTIMSIFNINILSIYKLLTSFGIGVFLLLLGFLFIALKDVVANAGAGMILSFSTNIKLGKIIKLGDDEGEIRKISKLSVSILTNKGEMIRIPNKILLNEKTYFKKTRSDIFTLEQLQKYFVSQKPSYCGPSSAAIALSIFGYDFTQEEIGALAKTEVGKGTHPVELGKVVERLTDKKVLTLWIDFDKITDVKHEIASWLQQDALVMVDYKKSFVFPEAKKAHYSLCVAVQADELLLIDPSPNTGGVYYVNVHTIARGMDTYSKLIGGKRGYLVYAPKGSTAYYRIKNGLFYSDKTLYEDITKKLEKELDKILTNSKIIENILPPKLRKYMKKKEKEEKVIRLWKVGN